jgi:hypothetical protein
VVHGDISGGRLGSGCFKRPHSDALRISVAVEPACEREFLCPHDPPDHPGPIEIDLKQCADAAFCDVGKRATAKAGGIRAVLLDELALSVIHKLPGLTSVSKRIVCRHRTPAAPVNRAIAQGDLSMAVELHALEVEIEDVVPTAELSLRNSGR